MATSDTETVNPSSQGAKDEGYPYIFLNIELIAIQVNLGVGEGGKLSLTDYFQPYDYQNLDGGDQDLGSGGITLLDPTVFKGTGVSKIAVTAGKNGKIYIMNANNLGGYRLGPGQTDGIIQTIVTNKAVFGGCGSYPLEGGYLYSTPVGYPTYVYKLGFSGTGKPIFSQVGQTRETSAGRVGVGIPTITTAQGKEGTAILWMCDPDAGLRAWYAVPQADGFLKPINLPQVNGLNKFQRPVFGDSRLYVTDPNGGLYCLGSPVNLPLTCSSPVTFGSVALGSSATQTVNCTANIAITRISDVTVGDAHFEVDMNTLPQGAVPKGASFSFPVTWNLTMATTRNTPNASYGNISPGVKSTALTISTVNAVEGYSTSFPISLTGTQVSNKAFLVLAPITVDYGGVVLLPNQSTPSITSPFTISNAGLSALTIKGFAYTSDELDNSDIAYTNATTSGDGTWDLGVGFTSSNLPAVGTVINGGDQISVDSSFKPINGVGSYLSYFFVWTTGGAANIILEGSASTAPIANFSISNSEGGWLPEGNLVMDFGTVAPGTTTERQIRICNEGGSVLEVSKSKPPNGAFRPEDPTSLHESQSIAIGECAYATVLFVTNAENPNIPDQVFTNSWTLNTDDLTFGVHEVLIKGTLVARKVGPTNSTGDAVYTYLGCYIDNAPAGRLLPNQQYADNNNDNGRCQTACEGKKYIFSGTEYQTECYCGNKPPPTTYKADETFCTFACSGDATQECGGAGGYLSVYYDATQYTPGSDADTPTQPTGGPQTVNATGNYNFIGCYSEGTAGRALSGKAPAAPETGTTIESCQKSCQGYQFFGTEFSNECYCGNTISAGSVKQESDDPDTNGCSMLCGGNEQEYCGGPNRINMYQLNGSLPVPTGSVNPPTTTGGPSIVQEAGDFDYLGCYTEATNGRALSGLANPVDGATLTVDKCAAACNMYTYFGVEYSGECYCGNSLNTGAVLASGGSDPASNGCSMTCNGNVTTYCGGAYRLNTYKKNSTLASGATSTSGASTSAAVSATPSPTGPITVEDLTGYTYLGCYSEATQGRALSDLGNPIPGNTVTPAACAQGCAKYFYFGVEYSGECYCGNNINVGSALVPGDTPDVTQCNMKCNGNSTELCGGPNRLNMYKKAASTSTSGTASQTSAVAQNSSSTSATSSGIPSSGTTSTGTSSSSTSAMSSSVSSTGSISSTSASSSQSSPSSTVSSSSSSSTSASTTSGTSAVSSTLSTDSTSSTSASPSQSSISNTVSSSSSSQSSTSSTVSPSSSSQSSTSSTSGPTSQTSTISNASPVSSTSIGSSTSVSSTSSTSSTSSVSITLSITPSSSSSTSSTTTSSATTSTPTVGQISNDWAYLGCANETNPRALSGASYTSTTAMTIESCQSFCSSSTNNYGLAGLEYGGECYCGNGLQSYSAIGYKGCTMACTGNKTELCGGASRLSLYNLTTYVPPTTVKQVGTYLSQGCYNEAPNGRLLAGASYTNSTGMTVESCVNFCSARAATYAGLEYAQECYCADSLPATATMADDAAKCNMLCTGNKKEFCGAAALLNVYRNTPESVSAAGTPETANSPNGAVIAPNTTEPGAGGKVKREEDGGRRGEGFRFRR